VAIKRHELAIVFSKLRAYQDTSIPPSLYLHLVWLHRLNKDFEREKAAMAVAAQAYLEYLEKGYDLPDHLSEPGIFYLIGELHRRQGLAKEARRFFERALASKEIRSYPRIADMIRDMMLVAKEQMDS
jgi:cytosine/adenosine deaminase-related metal-dependent hydrolase